MIEFNWSLKISKLIKVNFTLKFYRNSIDSVYSIVYFQKNLGDGPKAPSCQGQANSSLVAQFGEE